MTAKSNFQLLAAIMSFMVISFGARAQSSASGSIDLTSLTVTPATGSISWASTGWSLNAVSVTGDSDGELDPESNSGTSPATVSVSSAVTYASANTSATATTLDPSGVSGYANGAVNIPSGLNESAFVSGGYGNFSSLDTQFTLSQDSSVSFSAVLATAQDMMTDAGGQVLQDEVIFGLYVGYSPDPTLFYDNPLTLGPSASFATSDNPTLAASVSLTAGTYDLYLELDDEQQVLEAPDQGQTGLLLLAALGALAAARTICGIKTSLQVRP